MTIFFYTCFEIFGDHFNSHQQVFFLVLKKKKFQQKIIKKIQLILVFYKISGIIIKHLKSVNLRKDRVNFKFKFALHCVHFPRF